MRVPSLPLPEPLRGSEIGSFAHNTVAVRLATIARRTLEENNYPPAICKKYKTLIADLPYGQIRLLDDPGAPDLDDWEAYLAPYLSCNWLEVPWFFAEAYFYRRLLEASGYFQPGEWSAVDPFTYQKRRGLEHAQAGLTALVTELAGWRERGSVARDLFTRLLATALWGNQVDLSIWPAGQPGQTEQPSHGSRDQASAHLLVDDTWSAFEYLTQSSPARVDFVLDNAGFELVCDLLLADFLLETCLAEQVCLHAKLHPTFVSDTMPKDFHETLAFLGNVPQAELQALSRRLAEAHRLGRLHIKAHLFWNSPLPAWQMPITLAEDLQKAGLVIFKGDANYRRSVGDLHWSPTTVLQGVVGYFLAPLLLLRTLKSEVVVGLPTGRSEELFNIDPNWMTNGRWGVIQYCPVERRSPARGGNP